MSIIIPYFKEYLKWLQIYGLPYYENYILQYRKYLDNIVRKYVIRHPSCEELKFYKYPYYHNLYGGQIEKLNKIYNAILSVDTEKVKETKDDVVELNRLMEELERKITSLSEIEKRKYSQSVAGYNETIQSIINHLKVGIKNLNEISVINEVINIPQPEPALINYTPLNINEIIADFMKKLQKIEKDRKKDVTLFNEEISSLTNEISIKIAEIIEKNIELEKVINEIIIKIKEIKDETNFTLNKDDISIIPEFDDFLNYCYETIKNDKVKQIFLKFYEIAHKKDMILSETVDNFNNEILPYCQIVRNETKYKNFLKYYDGINSNRINNLFFTRDKIVNISMIKDLIIKDSPTIKIPDNEKDIYKLFLEFPEQKQEKHKIDEQPIQSVTKIVQKMSQSGGVFDIKDSLSQDSKLMQQLIKYNSNVDLYNKKVVEYNELVMEQFMHTVFLIMVATNQTLISGYVIYNYIQRGTLSLYKRILVNMKKDIEKNPQTPQNIYLLKYHKMTIYKLYNFVSKIVDYLNKIKGERVHSDVCKTNKEKCMKDDIVDINNCVGETANRFLLLNHFKEILMQYNALYSSKVTIYARINNLGDVMNPSDKQMCDVITYLSGFDIISRKEAECQHMIGKKENKESEEDISDNFVDVYDMFVNLYSCKKIQSIDAIPKIKFTEVFDSTQYPTSSDISKYMTVETLLSQGRGIAMMTYGYSGTGKSFTLFGKSEKNISGILQTALNDIRGLQSIKFRLMELYGMGIPYPHYWKNGLDKINHKLIHYNVSHGIDGLSFSNTIDISPKDFESYVNEQIPYNKVYNKIPENMISNIFKKFESFVTLVDLEREKHKRIRDTPNNPVSSRSVVIYDFQLKILGFEETIPFLIIDLPGREEIVQTYVEQYLNNNVILELLDINKKSDYYKKINLILGLASINPLGLAVFEPKIIKDTIMKSNSRDELIGKMRSTFFIKKPCELDKKGITNYENSLKLLKSNPNNKFIGNEKDGYNVEGDFSLLEEIINPKGTPLSVWFKLSGNGNKMKFEHTEHLTGFGYRTPEQLECILSVHLMNRIIMKNRFDLLEIIVKDICDRYINNIVHKKILNMNNQTLQQFCEKIKITNFKSLYWTKYFEENETTQWKRPSDEQLKEIFEYNYYLTPYEGIYINENIIGLIKYLAKTSKITAQTKTQEEEKEENDKAEKFVKDIICEQDQTLTFSYQQKVVRVWTMTAQQLGDVKEDIIDNDKIRQFFNFPNPEKEKRKSTKCVFEDYGEIPERFIIIDQNKKIKYDYSKFDNMYNKLIKSYHSDYIFNFNKPIITDILDKYISQIFDYKVLYLLANDKEQVKRERRCLHQYKLLQNTIDFIESIVGK